MVWCNHFQVWSRVLMRYRIPRQSRQSFCIPPCADSLKKVKFTRAVGKVRPIWSSSLTLFLFFFVASVGYVACCSRLRYTNNPLRCRSTARIHFVARRVTGGHGTTWNESRQPSAMVFIQHLVAFFTRRFVVGISLRFGEVI